MERPDACSRPTSSSCEPARSGGVIGSPTPVVSPGNGAPAAAAPGWVAPESSDGAAAVGAVASACATGGEAGGPGVPVAGGGDAAGGDAVGGAGAVVTGVVAGAAAGTGGGGAAPRGGSRVSGSTYVSAAPTRTPRWTYGRSCSTSPDGPGSATGSPSRTRAPARTRSGPRWVSDALSPVAVRTVTVSPCVGTRPANVTSPATGARMGSVPTSAMSTPRCCPAAYGSLPRTNGRRTAPFAGHTHSVPSPARAVDAEATSTTTTPTSAVVL
ncbi:MAG: hypothetical protein KatS3mg012_0756 [Gaiellaceae bacterium]|nr:MAG: hypothetical protein KatS3mg012_0756 [Gaiellaceae bacterium]